MSSAILYVAIVVIWACVLIPRWLRRDSARWSAHVPATAIPGEVGADDDLSGEEIHASRLHWKPAPAGTVPGSTASASAGPGDGSQPKAAPVRPAARAEADEHRAEAAADKPEQDEAPPPPLTPEEVRHRMLSARRRLLGMLIALEVAAIALAVLGLAALWVVIPPSVMLTGYLLLLREVAHADAERARREREAAQARARVRERERERARTGPRTVPAAAATSPAAAPEATSAPLASDYDDAGPGRDFAPGLAGKYTASNAEVIRIDGRAGEDLYDQYTQNKLRAVGD